MSALGYEPAPGDVAAVRQAARVLGTVRERAELIESRLRAVSAGIGPNVWRGQAADAFHALLAELGPGLAGAAAAHGTGQEALDAYATALAEAQDRARRAEADASAATADRNRAAADRVRAASEAAQHDANAAAASARSANLRVQSLTTVDPIQQASIAPHIQHADTARAHAQGQATDARGRERAAGSAVAAAQGRLDGAHRQAEEAKDEHERAARIAAGELREAAAAAAQPSALTAVGKNGVLTLMSKGLGKGERNLRNPQFEHVRGAKRKDGDALREDLVVTLAAWSKEWQAAAYTRGVGVQGEHGEASAYLTALAVGASASAGVGALGAGIYGARADLAARGKLAEVGGKAQVGNRMAGAGAAGRAYVGAEANVGGNVSFGADRARVAADAGVFAGARADGSLNANLAGVGGNVGGEAWAGIGAEADVDAGYVDGKLRFQFGAGAALGVGGKVCGGFEVDVPKLADNTGDAARWTGRKIGYLFDWEERPR